MKNYYIPFRNPDKCDLYGAIKSGIKTVEGRKNGKKYRNIANGDVIFFDDKKHGILKCKVVNVNRYVSISSFWWGVP